MKRRDVLKYTMLVTGAAVSSPLLTSILSGCTTQPRVISYIPVFFSESDFELVTSLVDTILPKTDSPSASEVGVDQTIDSIVGKVYKSPDRESYSNNFSSFRDYISKQAGNESFVNLNDEKKLEILRTLDKSKESELETIRKAYIDLKQQTVSFYLSSEEIGENYLNYLPVPGKYEACVPLSSVGGKAWSI